MTEEKGIAASMRRKLEAAFEPVELEIIDESHRHEGHAGHDGLGESHFRLRIRAAAFDGLSRIERQRRVYRVVDAELKSRVHALALDVKGSEEG